MLQKTKDRIAVLLGIIALGAAAKQWWGNLTPWEWILAGALVLLAILIADRIRTTGVAFNALASDMRTGIADILRTLEAMRKDQSLSNSNMEAQYRVLGDDYHKLTTALAKKTPPQ